MIERGELCEIAAAFTFGREDLLPDVFGRIVERLAVDSQGALDDFKFYLHRHIALDGEEHGPMANRLVEMLCGCDETKWQAATSAAAECLESRRQLWDAIHVAVRAG